MISIVKLQLCSLCTISSLITPYYFKIITRKKRRGLRRTRLRQWQPRENTSGPAISIHHGFLDQHVFSELGHQHRPHQIIQRTECKDSDRDHAVQVVGEFVVDALAGRGGHVGCHDEVALGEEEENGDGEGGADAGVPVGETRFAGEVDPDEAGRDEDVDDGEGVGDETVIVSLIFRSHSEWKNSLDQEVVRITWRRRQQDNNRHNPVLEETRSRRVERPVTSPDLRKG